MSVTEVASYNVRPEPLSPSAVAFGDVAEWPIDSRRRYLSTFVDRSDEATKFSIWISNGVPIGVLPLKLTTLERHPYSAQTFIPLGSGRYLAIVCPAAPDGGPDLAALWCFIAGAHQSITYARNVWHHPMTVLDNTMEFVVAMGMTGRRDDDVFVSLDAGVIVVMPQTS